MIPKIEHYWSKGEGENAVWKVFCKNKNKYFYPDEVFNETGECPFCGKNALSEIETRKRVKAELERQEKMKDDVKKRNTLEGW